MRLSKVMLRVKRAPLFVCAFALTGSAVAGGFQLWEQDASGIGNYHAGAAAEANSAGTEYYNPAGMTRLKHPQVSLGASFIDIKVRYTGQVIANFPTFSLPLGVVRNQSGDTFNLVPNLHLVIPFHSRWAFGFGVTTPFGLETDYPDANAGPFSPSVNKLATKTELQTINVNPSIAYQVNKYLSLAAGFDVLYGKANYDSDFFYPLNTHLTGWDCGYNLGALLQFVSGTRVGVSYRSEIKVNATGRSSAGTALTDNNASAVFPLPATTMLTLYQKINQQWAVMASAFYTQWSVFKSLKIKGLETPSGPGTINLLENYRNTWNFSAGVVYHFNHHLGFTMGFGHDETPTQIGYRDIRLPDNNRYALAFGVIIKPRQGMVWSMGYTHFFLDRTQIDNRKAIGPGTTAPALPPSALGYVDGDVNVFGTQFSINLR